MSKKLVCLVLFLALLVTVAFAEAPSMKISALTTVKTAAVSENGTALPSDFAISQSAVPTVQQYVAFEELAAYSASGAAVVNFFGADVHNAVETLLLSTGVNADSLKLSEFATMTVSNYDASYGDVKVTIGLPTVYAANQTVIVVIGYDVNGTMTWVPVAANVVNGELEVVVPQSVLEATTDFVVAVLND